MANLEISQLRALNAIVQNGGVIRAAEELHFTQGAVSAQIRKLEQTVGQKLLRRQGRGVALTPEGESLLRYARQILEINDQAMAHMRHGQSNHTVNIGIPTDMADPYLIEILNSFTDLHPEVQIRPHFNNTTELLKLFNQNVIDFVIGVDVEQRGKEIARAKVSWFFNGDDAITRRRPLPIVTGENPSARRMIARTMETANIPFDFLPGAADVLAHAAIVNAGLAVTFHVDRADGHPQFERVPQGLLPAIPDHFVFALYDDTNALAYLKDLDDICAECFHRHL